MKPNRVDLVSRGSTVLALTEIGLGSVIHGLYIPLGGHLLALNQTWLLSRASLDSLRIPKQPGTQWTPGMISLIAAILKSLSPAGQRLIPMLAISTQGILFNLGTLLLGRNRFGLALGASLMALWGFIQTVLFYWLLFGKPLIDALIFYSVEIQNTFGIAPKHLGWVLLTLVLIKVFLAIALALLAAKQSPEQAKRMEERLALIGRSRRPQSGKRATPPRGRWRAALRDLFSPFFSVSIIITAVFLGISYTENQTLFLAIGRPIAIGLILFFVMRLLPVEKVLVPFLSRASPDLGKSLHRAIQTVRSIH